MAHVEVDAKAPDGFFVPLVLRVLSVFQDCCTSSMMASVLNPYAFRSIIDHMDSLNICLKWIDESISDDNSTVSLDISEQEYQNGVSLLNEYANPYSLICSGYISFSRGRLSADIKILRKLRLKKVSSVLTKLSFVMNTRYGRNDRVCYADTASGMRT